MIPDGMGKSNMGIAEDSEPKIECHGEKVKAKLGISGVRMPISPTLHLDLQLDL